MAYIWLLPLIVLIATGGFIIYTIVKGGAMSIDFVKVGVLTISVVVVIYMIGSSYNVIDDTRINASISTPTMAAGNVTALMQGYGQDIISYLDLLPIVILLLVAASILGVLLGGNVDVLKLTVPMALVMIVIYVVGQSYTNL
jgi:hypothetical protein